MRASESESESEWLSAIFLRRLRPSPASTSDPASLVGVGGGFRWGLFRLSPALLFRVELFLQRRWGVWAESRSSEVRLGSAGPWVSESLAVVLSPCRGCLFRRWLPLFLDLLAVRSLLGLLRVRRGSPVVSVDDGG